MRKQKAKNSEKCLYWPPAVTVDVVIFTIKNGALKTLLIKRKERPFAGKFALPGGFLLKNETAEAAANRVLKEKAGVKNVFLEQLCTFDSPSRDPWGHVLTVAYFALVNFDKIKIKESGETQTPEFIGVKKLPALAFDHGKIIQYALRRLRYKLEYTNAVYSLLPAAFTFGQLQNVYETILGEKLDKRNFRKKFFSLKLIAPIKGAFREARRRPARLYRFLSRKPVELKRFF